MWRSGLTMMVAVAAGLGVAACGSSNTAHTNPVTVTKTQTVTINTTGSATSPATGTSTAAPTTTTGTATGTTSTATSTGTTTSSTSTSATQTGTTSTSGGSGLSGSHCTASGLTPVSRSINGAAGTIVWEVALKNTGATECATEGYPGVQFLDASGNAVGKPATRSTSWAGGTIQPRPIELKPGESAYFYLDVNDAAGGGAGCTGVSALQIYAPDDTTAMQLTASAEIQYCPKLTVTPLTADAGSQ